MRQKHGHGWKRDMDMEGGEFGYYSGIRPDRPKERNY